MSIAGGDERKHDFDEYLQDDGDDEDWGEDDWEDEDWDEDDDEDDVEWEDDEPPPMRRKYFDDER